MSEMLKQDVVVVVRERRHDVGLVAELDQRDQIAVASLHAQPDETVRPRPRS